MSSKTQMEELKELLDFGCELGNGVGGAFGDGKIDLSDAKFLVPPVMVAPQAFSGATEAFEKLKTLSSTESDELHAHVKTKFDIPQDEVEEKVEGAIKLVLGLWVFIKPFVVKA